MYRPSVITITLDDSSQSSGCSASDPLKDSSVNLNTTFAPNYSEDSSTIHESEKKSAEEAGQESQDTWSDTLQLFVKGVVSEFQCEICSAILQRGEIFPHFKKHAQTHRLTNRQMQQMEQLMTLDDTSPGNDQSVNMFAKSPTVTTTTPTENPKSARASSPNYDDEDDDNDVVSPVHGGSSRSDPHLTSGGEVVHTGHPMHNNSPEYEYEHVHSLVSSQAPQSTSSEPRTKAPFHHSEMNQYYHTGQSHYPDSWIFPRRLTQSAGMPLEPFYSQQDYNMWPISNSPQIRPYPQSPRGCSDPYFGSVSQNLNYPLSTPYSRPTPTSWYPPNCQEPRYSAGYNFGNNSPAALSNTIADNNNPNFRQSVADLEPATREPQKTSSTGTAVPVAERVQRVKKPPIRFQEASLAQRFAWLQKEQKDVQSCVYCLRSFGSARSLKYHVHKWQVLTEDVPSTRYQCKLCKKEFKSGLDVLEHQESTHNVAREKGWRFCHSCGRRMCSERNLTMHENLGGKCKRRFSRKRWSQIKK